MIRIDVHIHEHPGIFDRLKTLITKGFKDMADQLDTVIERVTAQGSLADSINELVDTWVADRADLRAQIEALKAQLGEAGNDTEQVTAILATLDASDAKFATIRDKLAPAVVANTPEG